MGRVLESSIRRTQARIATDKDTNNDPGSETRSGEWNDRCDLVSQIYSQQETTPAAVDDERSGCASPGQNGITLSFIEQHTAIR